MTREEIARKQHKVVEESDFMLDFVEPMMMKFNAMIGRYQPVREDEFSVEAGNFDTIRIHARPQLVAAV